VRQFMAKSDSDEEHESTNVAGLAAGFGVRPLLQPRNQLFVRLNLDSALLLRAMHADKQLLLRRLGLVEAEIACLELAGGSYAV